MLTPGPRSPGLARRWLAASLADRLDREDLETAVLVVSELVGSLVTVGGQDMQLSLQLEGRRLRLRAVCAGGWHGTTAATPRGVRALEVLALRWGLDRTGAWAELAVHPRGPARQTDS